MLVNTPQAGGSWTSMISRAAWTLLLVTIVVWIAWQLLQQLLVPLITVLALVGLYRLTLGLFRGGGRW